MKKIWIENFIDKLTGKNIALNFSENESRFFLATANVQILSFFITGFMEIISNINYSGKTLLFIHFVDAELMIEMLIAWQLQRKGFFMTSRILTCISLIIHIAWIGFGMPNSQVHYFWTSSALIPLIIFPRKNYFMRIIFTTLPLLILFFHQYYFRVIGSDGWFEVYTLKINPMESLPGIVLSQILLIFLVFRFLKATNLAEDNLFVEHQKSERLLLNILPASVANELKEKGFNKPVLFESASVCFTDFVGFTKIAETMSPEDLVQELDFYFSNFDKIISKFNLEKLKTIGDSFMFAGGVPIKNQFHAIDCVSAALEIQEFMKKTMIQKNQNNLPVWELRIGIHSGAIVAGVIGEKKFAYDVWGDTVNTASRCESSGLPNRINISNATYELVKEKFECEFRGEIDAKNKDKFTMYLLTKRR